MWYQSEARTMRSTACGDDRSWPRIRRSRGFEGRSINALNEGFRSKQRREQGFHGDNKGDLPHPATIPDVGFVEANRERRSSRRACQPAGAEPLGFTEERYSLQWTAHSYSTQTSANHSRTYGNFYLEDDFDFCCFDGNSYDEDYLDWELMVDGFFACNDIPPKLQARIVASKLTDRAKAWWNLIKHARRLEGRKDIQTWSRMKRLMRDQFIFIDVDDLLYYNFIHKEKKSENERKQEEAPLVSTDVKTSEANNVIDESQEFDHLESTVVVPDAFKIIKQNDIYSSDHINIEAYLEGNNIYTTPKVGEVLAGVGCPEDENLEVISILRSEQIKVSMASVDEGSEHSSDILVERLAAIEDKMTISVIKESINEMSAHYYICTVWNSIYQKVHLKLSFAPICVEDYNMIHVGKCLSVSISFWGILETCGGLVCSINILLKEERLNEYLPLSWYKNNHFVFYKDGHIERFKRVHKWNDLSEETNQLELSTRLSTCIESNKNLSHHRCQFYQCSEFRRLYHLLVSTIENSETSSSALSLILKLKALNPAEKCQFLSFSNTFFPSFMHVFTKEAYIYREMSQCDEIPLMKTKIKEIFFQEFLKLCGTRDFSKEETSNNLHSESGNVNIFTESYVPNTILEKFSVVEGSAFPVTLEDTLSYFAMNQDTQPQLTSTSLAYFQVLTLLKLTSRVINESGDSLEHIVIKRYFIFSWKDSRELLWNFESCHHEQDMLQWTKKRNYPEWDEHNPIYFVGHSAQVVRVLQQMLADKVFEGYENTSEDWLLSLTCLSGGLNGTTTTYFDGMQPEDGRSMKTISILQLLTFVFILYDWAEITFLKNYYNFGFDHFEMGWKKFGLSGLIDLLLGNSGPFASGDWILTNLTIQGSMILNANLQNFQIRIISAMRQDERGRCWKSLCPQVCLEFIRCSLLESCRCANGVILKTCRCPIIDWFNSSLFENFSTISRTFSSFIGKLC